MMTFMSPSEDLVPRNALAAAVVAFPEHRLDRSAPPCALGERQQPGDGSSTSCNDDFLAGFDSSDKLGEALLGFADLDGDRHGRLAVGHEVAFQ